MARIKILECDEESVMEERTLEFLIGYWITAMSLEYHLDDMVEISDELGETYEFIDWLAYSHDGDGESIMDVHIHLEKAYDIAVKTREKIEKELSEKMIEESNQENLKDHLETFFEKVTTDFDEIYEERIEDSIHNFMQTYENFIKEL